MDKSRPYLLECDLVPEHHCLQEAMVSSTQALLDSGRVPAMAAVDIMGLGCRFPESANASEFWDNLKNSRDMVTCSDARWPVGLHGTPPRFGKVPDFDRFDASFFSVHGKQAQVSKRRSCSPSRQTDMQAPSVGSQFIPS